MGRGKLGGVSALAQPSETLLAARWHPYSHARTADDAGPIRGKIGNIPRALENLFLLAMFHFPYPIGGRRDMITPPATARENRVSEFGFCRLWSLWEMLRVYGHKHILLGQNLSAIRVNALLAEPPGQYNKKTASSIRKTLRDLLQLCDDLDLPISKPLVNALIKRLPTTIREVDLVASAIRSELENKFFLFIPAYKASYFERTNILSDTAQESFPTSYVELIEAGNCFAASLHTACVFHAMRAAEIGVRVLGDDLKIGLQVPIELAEWQVILNGIHGAIRQTENQPKTQQRADDLEFYSQAAAQFRFFKNGWRVRAAHARDTFSENQAKEAIDHVASFFEILASRLKE